MTNESLLMARKHLNIFTTLYLVDSELCTYINSDCNEKGVRLDRSSLTGDILCLSVCVFVPFPKINLSSYNSLRTQVSPSEAKWTQVNPNKLKWTHSGKFR